MSQRQKRSRRDIAILSRGVSLSKNLPRVVGPPATRLLFYFYFDESDFLFFFLSLLCDRIRLVAQLGAACVESASSHFAQR